MRKFNPLVSIVIPVYNGENYLKEAIDSALAQTYENIEIIVVNDGSVDNTESIAKSYGNKIKYFKKKNGGTSTALNLGIKNMKGEYFSWLSHDDMYYPNKIKRQIEELSKLKNRNTIMMTDLDGINEKYKKIYKTNYIEHINEYPPREKSFLHPIIYNQTHGCTLLIPKKCFEEVGLFDEKQLVAQDFEFFYRAFSKFPHKLIPEILVTARDSSNRQGRRSHSKGDEEYSALYIKMINNLTEEDYKLLAPSKIEFFKDMKNFFHEAGYTIAYNYIISRMISNLQISSNDIIGNKFNGYDLHLCLRKNGMDSKMLVLNKESNDINTIKYNFLKQNATKNLLTKTFFLESEIIHMHLIHNIIDLNYLPIISKIKPTVITLHDPFFLGGHCVHHFDCEKWKEMCYDCQYLNEEFPLEHDISSLNFILKKDNIQRSNIFAIVSSKWMEKQVKQSPIWKNKKIYFLPFGINQNIFKPISKSEIIKIKKDLKINVKNSVIMLRADDGKFKGLDIVKNTLNKIDEKNISIIVVGKKNLLNEFKNKFDIHEYGWIKDDLFLAKLYQISDLFLMPSRQETFGLMAIEAMNCETLVIALDSPGSALPEVINSPSEGIAVKEEKYPDTVIKMLKNNSLRNNLAKKCYEFAKENYNLETYLEKLTNIYLEIIEFHKNNVMNVESKVLLSQLKKIKNTELDESTLMATNNKILYLYRKLPINFRKKVKRILRLNETSKS